MVPYFIELCVRLIDREFGIDIHACQGGKYGKKSDTNECSVYFHIPIDGAIIAYNKE